MVRVACFLLDDIFEQVAGVVLPLNVEVLEVELLALFNLVFFLEGDHLLGVLYEKDPPLEIDEIEELRVIGMLDHRLVILK